jgi:signal transduction histidine kinase
MFIFYAIFFIGIIILIVKLNGLSLKRRAEYLAKEVDKATTEIRKQKEEVEKEKIKTEEALKDLKNAQIQLIQSEKMASLGTLTAGVAHEINNPLNYIAGGCSGLEQILKERNINDDKINVLLNAIKIGVEKASQIIRGLNQFSKTTSNKKETENIHQIIDNSLAILKSQIPDRIEITKSYYPEPIYINGNISDLHQMVVNIIINAVQAIPERGNIHISTNISQNKINIEFIDTGIGIIKENLAKITDPFFTTKEQGKGTGLGLSIAYSIIKDHEGIIDFESEVGKGTTVKVRLKI